MIGRLDQGRRVRVTWDMNGLTRELVARGCTGRARGPSASLGRGQVVQAAVRAEAGGGCRQRPGPMGLPPAAAPAAIRPAATAGGRGASAGSGPRALQEEADAPVALPRVLRRQAPISRRSPVRPWPGAATHSSGRSGPSSAARSRAFTVSRTFSRLTLAGAKPPSAYASCRRSVRLASAKKNAPRKRGVWSKRYRSDLATPRDGTRAEQGDAEKCQATRLWNPTFEVKARAAAKCAVRDVHHQGH